MICIRPAEKNESGELTELAIKSEAYWGYESDMMEKFKEIYKITEEFLSQHTTFVLSDDDRIIGFYALLISQPENSLESFYIDSKSIGKGYGKVMCEHMKNYCKSTGIKEISLVTSPQVKKFYEKMGAVYVTEVDSLIKKGRIIPKLKFKF